MGSPPGAYNPHYVYSFNTFPLSPVMIENPKSFHDDPRLNFSILFTHMDRYKKYHAKL
jgi:hypothetical protein